MNQKQKDNLIKNEIDFAANEERVWVYLHAKIFVSSQINCSFWPSWTIIYLQSSSVFHFMWRSVEWLISANFFSLSHFPNNTYKPSKSRTCHSLLSDLRRSFYECPCLLICVSMQKTERITFGLWFKNVIYQNFLFDAKQNLCTKYIKILIKRVVYTWICWNFLELMYHKNLIEWIEIDM